MVSPPTPHRSKGSSQMGSCVLVLSQQVVRNRPNSSSFLEKRVVAAQKRVSLWKTVSQTRMINSLVMPWKSRLACAVNPQTKERKTLQSFTGCFLILSEYGRDPLPLQGFSSPSSLPSSDILIPDVLAKSPGYSGRGGKKGHNALMQKNTENLFSPLPSIHSQ